MIVHNWPLLVGTADAVPAAPVSTSFVPVVDQVPASTRRSSVRKPGTKVAPETALHVIVTDPLLYSVADASPVTLERHVTPFPHGP